MIGSSTPSPISATRSKPEGVRNAAAQPPGITAYPGRMTTGLIGRAGVPEFRIDTSGQPPNVSQAAIAPDFRPFMNHVVRCFEVPWVKESGTT